MPNEGNSLCRKVNNINEAITNTVILIDSTYISLNGLLKFFAIFWPSPMGDLGMTMTFAVAHGLCIATWLTVEMISVHLVASCRGRQCLACHHCEGWGGERQVAKITRDLASSRRRQVVRSCPVGEDIHGIWMALQDTEIPHSDDLGVSVLKNEWDAGASGSAGHF